jgi:hypothetical protein
MVFNATFDFHWQALFHNVVSGLELITLVVIGTDCRDSCKSNCHAITTTKVRYNGKIVKSGVKHHKHNPNPNLEIRTAHSIEQGNQNRHENITKNHISYYITNLIKSSRRKLPTCQKSLPNCISSTPRHERESYSQLWWWYDHDHYDPSISCFSYLH